MHRSPKSGVYIFAATMEDITKEKLIEIVKSLLGTDGDLGFLIQLKKTELETLAASIRDRVEGMVKLDWVRQHSLSARLSPQTRLGRLSTAVGRLSNKGI